MRWDYREALLRPEWARLYPGVPASVWLPADDVASYVRGHAEVIDGKGAQNRRILSGVHFEFRGEGSRRFKRVFTRASDNTEPTPGHASDYPGCDMETGRASGHGNFTLAR